MSGLTIRRSVTPALALIGVAVVVVVPALAATPRTTTVTTVGGTIYKINRLSGDTMRFKKDVYEIKSGGTLVLKDRTGDGHTLSLARRSSLPRTRKQLDNCFEGGLCATIAGPHQFPEGESQGPPVPAKPVVDPDGKGLNRAGDSIYVAARRSVRIKVGAKRGRTLRFLCIIHPWMQSKIKVK